MASILADGFTDIFPSKEVIRLAECPTLIVHGSLDRVIPVSQSKALHRESGAICKKLVILEGIGHHGIDLHIAVVNDAPKMFSLGGDPKDLNIDGLLSNPAQTNGRILSPVRQPQNLQRWRSPFPINIAAPYFLLLCLHTSPCHQHKISPRGEQSHDEHQPAFLWDPFPPFDEPTAPFHHPFPV